jgi:hypothetical protein
MEDNKFLEMVTAYKSVIASFKNRTNVLNGQAIAWTGGKPEEIFLNTPKGIGDGLGTTGWCVSASDALLNDEIFQLCLATRNAKAKLISIDLKEQWNGYCYNGSQNKWHTAILVEEGFTNIIVDITCRQFGDQFIDKDIWTWETWSKVLRSPNCKHKISVRIDDPESIVPTYVPKHRVSDLQVIDLLEAMRDITNIDGSDRETMTGFLLSKMGEINSKMLIGNISVGDYKYIDGVNKLLEKMPFYKIEQGYTVLSFKTKSAAKEWLKLFLEGKGKLPNYVLVSQSVSASCQLNGYDEMDLNIAYRGACDPTKTYIVLEFGMLWGVRVDFMENARVLLPFGIQFNYSAENIYNGGRAIDGNTIDGKIVRETNAIFVKIDEQTY